MANSHPIGLVWTPKSSTPAGWATMWWEGACCCHEFVGVAMVTYRSHDTASLALQAIGDRNRCGRRLDGGRLGVSGGGRRVWVERRRRGSLIEISK